MDWPLRCGIFLAPFHPTGQNPTLSLQRDLELIEHLDRLGFDEAWIGEHHSAGYEIIASPELFIAAAAERTRHIRLGTGVVSLPYHHPFMTAQRMIQLDHLTRGRALLGVGPGALPSDAFMLGIDPAVQRPRMNEALDVILQLFRTTDRVTVETDWFTLRDAQLHLRPYSEPHPEVAVAAMVSPSGPMAAGRTGCSLLSIGATQKAGIDLLAHHWDVLEESAEEHGNVADRRSWRLVSMMHIAETREQAFADVGYGLEAFQYYFREVAALPVPFGDGQGHPAEQMNRTGGAVVGTPDDAVEFIQMLIDQSNGGFGTLLFQAHEWANPAATNRSYELFAQEVLPRFNGSLVGPEASMSHVQGHRDEFIGAAGAAVMAAFQERNDASS